MAFDDVALLVGFAVEPGWPPTGAARQGATLEAVAEAIGVAPGRGAQLREV